MSIAGSQHSGAAEREGAISPLRRCRALASRVVGTAARAWRTASRTAADAPQGVTSEAALRAMFENSAAGRCEASAETARLLSVNRRLCDMTGYAAGELLGITLDDVTHPADLPTHAELRRELLAGRMAEYAVELRLVRKDGSALWVRVCTTATRAAGPARKRVMAVVVIDIVDRKRAEEALARAERRLRRQNDALVALTRQPFQGDLAQDVTRIAEVAARTMDVARCSVWLYADGDGGALRCVDLFDAATGHHSAGARLSKAQYPAYFAAIEADRTITACDAHDDPRTREFSAAYLAPLGIGAMIDAPVRVNGKTLGVVCLEHVGGARQWTADEEGFADSVSTMVAAAIEWSERAAAQAALVASEARFRAFMDNSPAVAFVKDDRGRTIFASAGWERATGKRRETCVGRTDAELWPEHAEQLRRNDEAVWRDGTVTEVAETLPDAAGEPRHWLSFKFPMPSAPGEPRLLGAIAVDLTDRFAAEQARAKLTAIIEGSDDAIVGASLDGRITSWNGGAGHMFGYTADEAVGQHLSMLAPAAEAMNSRAEFERACRGHGVRQIEAVRVSKRGRLVDVSLNIFPTRDASGAVTGVAAIIRDIGDRRRFEAALAESERFARSAVDALTDHIAILDDTGEILAVNRAWRDFAAANGGCGADVGLGANYLAACDNGGWEGRLAADGIRAILRGERQQFDMEYPCHSPETERWFTMRVTHFTSGGGVRLVVSHEDVTARKRNEALQREQGSLRGAVAAMEQVLGVVGHELRTPLAGLRAMSEYLLIDGARGTDEAAQFLSEINQEVVRMGDTVDQILEAARLNSGRAKWNWSEFPLRQVCEDALDTVRPFVDASRVDVECDVHPEDATMLGDADAIRRLVMNLAGNSRRHTPDGRIRVAVQAATDDAGARWIDVRVSDTGTGIPPEIVSRLGEAFALNSGIVGARHVTGAGLGLAICKGIAAAHGGGLTVESVSGRGTTMTVRLRADLHDPACQGGKDVPRLARTTPAAAATMTRTMTGCANEGS